MQVLEDRKKTHGDFSDHARITGRLKNVMQTEHDVRLAERKQAPINYVQAEALDMIVHKIGRILAGNPDEPDHWLDIAGYATLVHQRLTTASVSNAELAKLSAAASSPRIQPRSTINSEQPKGIA